MFSILEMVSIVENIKTEDDSDAPVEVTTKTSKNEKRKKKKNTKRRIKYTLANEDDHPNHKRLDDESALTHLVFGDDDDYLEELTSVATTDKQVCLNVFG